MPVESIRTFPSRVPELTADFLYILLFLSGPSFGSEPTPKPRGEKHQDRKYLQTPEKHHHAEDELTD